MFNDAVNMASVSENIEVVQFFSLARSILRNKFAMFD